MSASSRLSAVIITLSLISIPMVMLIDSIVWLRAICIVHFFGLVLSHIAQILSERENRS